MKKLHFCVKKVYKRGTALKNEDAYVVDLEKLLFAVIDGATNLDKSETASGAVVANSVRNTLISWDGTGTLLEAVLKANEIIGTITKPDMNLPSDENCKLSGVSKLAQSSCGLAAVKLHSENGKDLEKLSFVHAGDCMIFVQYKDNSIRTLTYDHISKLDKQAIELHTKEWNNRLKNNENPNRFSQKDIKHNLKEIRKKILPLLQHNRKMMNTPEGYGILDGSAEAEKYLEHGTIGMRFIKKILLLSDGLQLPYEKASNQELWIESAQYAFDNGLESLMEQIIHLENTDPACFLYPRLKPADDKTGILISI